MRPRSHRKPNPQHSSSMPKRDMNGRESEPHFSALVTSNTKGHSQDLNHSGLAPSSHKLSARNLQILADPTDVFAINKSMLPILSHILASLVIDIHHPAHAYEFPGNINPFPARACSTREPSVQSITWRIVSIPNTISICSLS